MTKTRILVIDDDVHATRMIKSMLERTTRYEVAQLNDSNGAADVARQFKPDLILLDICMPGAEGVEVAFRIRSDSELQRTPVVFLTSLVSEREAIGDGTPVGAFHFIAKPPRLRRLVAAIESNLEMAHAAEQLCLQGNHL
jgi:DNA-binding response OmpR family regulator